MCIHIYIYIYIYIYIWSSPQPPWHPPLPRRCVPVSLKNSGLLGNPACSARCHCLQRLQAACSRASCSRDCTWMHVVSSVRRRACSLHPACMQSACCLKACMQAARILYATAIANIQLMSMLLRPSITHDTSNFIKNAKEFNTFADRAEENIASCTTGEGRELIDSILIASAPRRYIM